MAIEFSYIDADTGVRINSATVDDPQVESAIIGVRGGIKEGISGSSSSDYVIKAAIPSVARDMLDASETRARNDLTFGLLTRVHSAGTTTVNVNVDESRSMAFKADIPIIIGATIEDIEAGTDSTKFEYRMPSAVGAASSAQAITVAALTNDYYENAVVIQPELGDVSYFGLGVSRERWAEVGVRLQLERPDAPTLAVVTATSTSITISVTQPTSNAYFANYVDVYAYETREEARRGPKPNAVPSTGDNDITQTTTISIIVDNYGGDIGGGGGLFASGTAYWITAVVKDKAGRFAQRRSLPATPITDTTL